MLVVDGDSGEREVLAESFYLISALDPVGDGSEGYDVSVIDEHQIADKDFADFDLVILPNVAQLDRENMQRLEKYVTEGGGFLLLSGDQVEATTWNRVFWKKGSGLLPAPLKDIGGDFDNSEALILVAEEHPIFAVAKEQLRKQLDLFVLLRRGHHHHRVGVVVRGDNHVAADPRTADRIEKLVLTLGLRLAAAARHRRHQVRQILDVHPVSVAS